MDKQRHADLNLATKKRHWGRLTQAEWDEASNAVSKAIDTLASAARAPARMAEDGGTMNWKLGNEYAPYHPDSSHVSPDYRDGWNACYEAAKAAQPPSQPLEVVAWQHEDGRVVPAATMDGARRDGGAMLSSLRDYSHALVRLSDAQKAIDRLRSALSASCEAEREMLYEAGPGGGCSRAIAAEQASREGWRHAKECDDARKEATERADVAINNSIVLADELHVTSARLRLAEEVIRELVACKELKARLEAWDAGSTDEMAWLAEEYNRRKPIAWERAREFLGSKADRE